MTAAAIESTWQKSPPLETVQRALRETTETLAYELADSGRQAPQWNDFQWLVARAAATIHGVSPLLSRSLLWQGPGGWGKFLEAQRAQTRTRYLRLQELLELLDTEARGATVPLIALKGAALHALGIYSPGERPMADLDLLARPADAQQAHQMLYRLGFQMTYATSRHQTFEPLNAQVAAPFGESSGNALKIELHTHIGESLPLHSVDISTLILPARPHDGVNAYPSSAALMAHLLLHAAGAMAQRAVRLIHLHDIAKLSGRLGSRDWDELLSAGSERNETLWWAFPPLALAARYYKSVPHEVLAATAARCQWLLRRTARRETLADVSLSNVWVTAFPGIKWARSVQEALRYAATRIAPSDETRGQRRQMVRSQPAMAGSAWESMSQARRIPRWLISRPGRPETLLPVRRALDEQP